MLQFFIAQSLASTLIGNQLSMIVQRSLFIGEIKLKFNHRKIAPHSVIKKFFFAFRETVIFGRTNSALVGDSDNEISTLFRLATTGCVGVMKFLQRVSFEYKINKARLFSFHRTIHGFDYSRKNSIDSYQSRRWRGEEPSG